MKERNGQRNDDVETLFAHKKVKKCTLSARLRTLRTVERLTQEDVAQRAHVRHAYVKALEEGRLDNLPAPVYVRGFLRSIARVLRAHPQQLVTLYERELRIKTNIKKSGDSVMVSGHPRRSRVRLYRAVFTPRQFFTGIGIILAFSGVIYLANVLHSFVAAPFIVIAMPENGAVIMQDHVTVSGTTDPSAVLLIGDAPVIVGQDGHFETDVYLHDGVNDIVVQATNRFAKTSRRTISIEHRSEKQPEVHAVAPTTVRLTVRVERARTWLDIRVDGETVLKKTVDAGYEETFEGVEIVITSGGAARTMVARDGGDFVPLADVAGLVKDQRFTVAGTANVQDSQ